MKDETVLCVSKFTAALSRDTISDKKARERERELLSLQYWETWNRQSTSGTSVVKSAKIATFANFSESFGNF